MPKKKRMRRANGTGSVSFLGKARCRPYLARAFDKKTGKRIIIGYFPDRPAADLALAAAEKIKHFTLSKKGAFSKVPFFQG